MYGMFYSMKSLEKLDISNFDASKVTDMGSMFEDVNNLEELILNNINTKNVVNMFYIFAFLTK